MKNLNFDNGNPIFTRTDGSKVTYTVDETKAWRQITHFSGLIEIHWAPVEYADRMRFWEPWNYEPESILESEWIKLDE